MKDHDCHNSPEDGCAACAAMADCDHDEMTYVDTEDNLELWECACGYEETREPEDKYDRTDEYGTHSF